LSEKKVEKMRIKTIGTLLMAGLVVLSAMVVFVTPAVAEEGYDPWITDFNLTDPALWLYIEGSTYNPSTSGDTWTAESWVNPVAFSYGATYTDYVDVIAHSKQNYAENPYFFVWVKDDTLISSITVGQALLFLGGTDQGLWGDSALTTDTFVDTSNQTGDQNDPDPNKHQGQTGYWVRIRIGNVPAVPDFSFGDPVPEPGEPYFDPANLKSYVRVPVTYTLTSDTTKDLTTLVIHYDAHNMDSDTDGALQSSTANSHDSSSYYIPEFTTIAIPVAAILGLLFFFNHRKRKE
jgi:hypothetical protein